MPKQASLKLPDDFCKDAKESYTLTANIILRQRFFTFETEEIFAKDWICVAHICELNEANQYITREILNETILIIRGDAIF